MQEIDLNDWLTFTCVVEEKGFTAAAKKLGLSPSVLSKRITRLETILKARLLQRTTRKFSLTDIGEDFYERCSRLKADIDDTLSIISKFHGKPNGKLRINAPMSFGQHHMISAVTDFMKLYPAVKLELLLGSHYANLLENGLDLAIFVKDLPDSSLQARRIALRRNRLYASPDYIAKHGKPTFPDDLKQHNCLLYQIQPVKHQWRFCHNGKIWMVPVKGNFKANSIEALASAAVAGLGIVKLPGYLMLQEIHEGKLETVLSEYSPKDIGIYAAYPNNPHLAPKVRILVDFLAERFGNKQYWNEE